MFPDALIVVVNKKRRAAGGVDIEIAGRRNKSGDHAQEVSNKDVDGQGENERRGTGRFGTDHSFIRFGWRRKPPHNMLSRRRILDAELLAQPERQKDQGQRDEQIMTM